MRLRLLLVPLKWLLALAAVGGLLYGAYLVRERAAGKRAEEGAEAEVPKRAANRVVKLGATLAESHGLEDEPANPAEWVRRVPAYGRVVPNPRATSEVRAAFGGTLRASADGAWPTLGTPVKGGQVLGYLDVRVGPQERLDLLTKLNEARVKFRGAEELVRLQQERADRLEAAGGGVSQSELDTARTQFTEASTQLAAARAAVKEWEDALESINRQGGRKDSTWSQPLTSPAVGEVVDLVGRPGTALEPGGLVARVVDFRFALVRLEMPPEALAAGPPAEVALFTAQAAPAALEGASNSPTAEPGVRSLTARLVGRAPQVEVNSQYAGFWYEADTGHESLAANGAGAGVWRPGLFVKAEVKGSAASVRVVSVPATSLLYHQGRALVYVRVGPGRYERREVEVLGRDGNRFVLSAGVTAGERVVSKRAQVLLSEEFRSDADND